MRISRYIEGMQYKYREIYWRTYDKLNISLDYSLTTNEIAWLPEQTVDFADVSDYVK